LFKAGVVAFSKEGIYGVAVTPSGIGYDGTTLYSTSMTYNDRTEVWEYWVVIDPLDFTDDDTIVLDAVVYGNDGGRRTLDTLSLRLDKGTLPQHEVWVTTGGNDSTGEIDNAAAPYASVHTATQAIQSAYGTCEGTIVWLGEGEWTLGNGPVTTTNEWLTYAGAMGTARENVIVHGSGRVNETDLLRFYDLTLRSDGYNDVYLRGWPGPEPVWLWVDSCRIIGSGRHTALSSPAMRDENWFCTDTYIYDVDNALRETNLARNVDIVHIGDDAVVNTDCAINITVNDQDPGDTYWHSDGWQNNTWAMDNKILYGYHGTDVRVQGLFIRMAPDVGVHTNNAFVNVLMEMREPGYPGYPGGPPVLSGANFYGDFDHLIMWHCTIPTVKSGVFEEENGVGFGFSNVSFVGNVFYELIDWVGQGSEDPTWGLPGNPGNNEFLHNHYIWSYVDGLEGWAIWSKSPDTDPSGSQSLGDPDIVTTLDAADYGTPNATSPLLDRLSQKYVPIDVLGNQRDTTPDVGAIERV
jgi:hypothetical protein